MKLYNTLTREKEEFTPIAGNKATMYSCGPTVYNYAHIGNLRTYIFMDLVRRALKLNGFKIKGVMNITDVGHLLSDGDEGEDKMALAAAEQKKTPYEIAEYYTGVFMTDIAKLNIGRPEIVAKATDHIKEMLDFVIALEEKGFAYETSDGIYFDIAKFPEYGKLSGINLDEQQAGARVEVNPEKRNAADFALWKKAPKEHIMQWPSPWGMGYPGWHIECSAMSRKYLGERFDIHTGGVDHIPIHHENEIAQSEALEGHPAVNVWMHGEFMLVDGGKMSKSLKNTYTVADLEERGYSALDFRYFCLNAHYRKKLNFTFTGLDAAVTSRERLNEQLWKHKTADPSAPAPDTEKFKAEFKSAIDDDLNVPQALGVLWTMLKEEKHPAVYGAALYMDQIFGLSLDKIAPPKEEPVVVPEEILALCEQRMQAKREKNYAESDRLRAEVEARGFVIADTAGGYEVKKKQ